MKKLLPLFLLPFLFLFTACPGDEVIDDEEIIRNEDGENFENVENEKNDESESDLDNKTYDEDGYDKEIVPLSNAKLELIRKTITGKTYQLFASSKDGKDPHDGYFYYFPKNRAYRSNKYEYWGLFYSNYPLLPVGRVMLKEERSEYGTYFWFMLMNSLYTIYPSDGFVHFWENNSSVYYSVTISGNDIIYDSEVNKWHWRLKYIGNGNLTGYGPVDDNNTSGTGTGGNTGGGTSNDESFYFMYADDTPSYTSATVAFQFSSRVSSATVKYGESSCTSTATSNFAGNRVTSYPKNLKRGTKYKIQCTAKGKNGETVTATHYFITRQ